VVATPAEFFHHLESKYGNSFPVYAGDWTGLWSEVKTNSPIMSANSRWAHDYFPVAEVIDSVRTLKTGRNHKGGEITRITTQLFKYDEHSGAGQYGWPTILTKDEVEEQNREYADYTSSAREQTQALISNGLIEVLSEKQDEKFKDNFVVFKSAGMGSFGAGCARCRGPRSGPGSRSGEQHNRSSTNTLCRPDFI
jgi:hypothetical protein